MANKNIFNSIQLKRPDSNVFDLTHDVKLSLDMGTLVPICIVDCIPGDKFQIGCESLLRFAPLVAPVMHRMDVTMHYFFVPNRILWPDWEKWITNEDTPVLAPYINIGPAQSNLPLVDYMGVPTLTEGTPDMAVSALPFAAYQKVWNDYYRDQNLQDDIADDLVLVSGNNTAKMAVLTTLRRRAWEHDYFTASLPFAQKGEAVQMPNQGDVPVYINKGEFEGDVATSPEPWDVDTPVGTIPVRAPLGDYEGPAGDIGQGWLYADTSQGAAPNINDLRRAFKLQEWLELNARAGTRYVENILAHFGVKSSDARLQRPEYITGTKSPVVISEILNTTGEDGGLPQGNMAGHGISVTAGKYGRYYCEEHGYIIGIMSVLPKPAYQQGLPKHFARFDKYDYFWPLFANLGEQAVLNQEIDADQLEADRKEIFGYVPRYSEYKYVPSRVAGDFKTSLDYWHLGRIFETPPALNADFIECNPSKRIFAVTSPDVNSLYCHVLNRIKAVRKMPKFGTPTF